MTDKQVTEKELLAMAMQVCIKHGKIPLDFSNVQSINSLLDLADAATEAAIRLQPAFQMAMEGITISKAEAINNYQALEDLKRGYPEQKRNRQQLRDLIKELESSIAVSVLGHDENETKIPQPKQITSNPQTQEQKKKLEKEIGYYAVLGVQNLTNLRQALDKVAEDFNSFTLALEAISDPPNSESFRKKANNIFEQAKRSLDQYAEETEKNSKELKQNMHNTINSMSLLIDISQETGDDLSGLKNQLTQLILTIPKAIGNCKGFVDNISCPPYTTVDLFKPSVINVLKACGELLFTSLAIISFGQEIIGKIK